MNNVPFKKSLKYATSAGLIAALILDVGCGKSSNPLAGYSVPAVPQYAKTIKNQDYLPPLLQVDVLGTNDQNFGIFYEGAPGQIRFSVRILDPEVKDYDLTAVQIPDGAQIIKSNEPNVWILKWTPPLGIVGEKKAAIHYPILIQAAPKGDLSLPVSTVALSSPLTITVLHDRRQPHIEGLNHLKANINEGEQTRFSVVVVDPSRSPEPPQIYPKRYNVADNSEICIADGTQFIEYDPGVETMALPDDPSGAKRWQINLIFNVQDRKIDLPRDRACTQKLNAQHVDSRVFLFAINGVGSISNDELARVVIHFAEQPPVMKVDAGNPNAVVAGQLNTFKFSVYTENQRGTVSIENLKSAVTALPGHAKLDECPPVVIGSPSHLVCTLEWNVPCLLKSKTPALTLRAVSAFDSSRKTASLIQRFQIPSQNSSCDQAPTSKSTKTSAKATAAKARQAKRGDNS